MENFEVTFTDKSLINFPEPFNGGWLKSYTEQVKVVKDPKFDQFGKIRFMDSCIFITFKFQKN